MKQILKDRSKQPTWKMTPDSIVRVSRKRHYPIVPRVRYLGLTLSLNMATAKEEIIKATMGKVSKVANVLRTKSAKIAMAAQLIYLGSIFRYYLFPLVLADLMDSTAIQEHWSRAVEALIKRPAMLPRMCVELIIPQIDWTDAIVKEAQRIRKIIPLFVDDKIIKHYNQ